MKATRCKRTFIHNFSVDLQYFVFPECLMFYRHLNALILIYVIHNEHKNIKDFALRYAHEKDLTNLTVIFSQKN
jgi:hypothetical protein